MFANILSKVRDISAKMVSNAAEPSPGIQLEATVLEDRLLYSATALPIDSTEGESTPIESDLDNIDQIVAEFDSTMNASDSDSTNSANDSAGAGESASTDQSSSPSAVEGMLTFTTETGHVLGFGQSSIFVGSFDHVLRMDFVGANDTTPASIDASGGVTSHDVAAPAFSQVSYAGVWDGVTAVYEAQDGAILKSTYYVDAGLSADATDQIRLHYNRDVRIDTQGNLVISYEHGTLTDSAPVAWQDIDGVRIYVDVNYVLLGNNDVGFALGDYDLAYQLVIDPTLTWNTFLGAGGSNQNDYAESMVIDSSGNVYVTGHSNATWGTPLRAHSGDYDVFVAKLSSSGSLTWNTFLGGNGGQDSAYGIDVDSSGNVYVTGWSMAGWGTPVVGFHGMTSADAFVAKLNSGGGLVWNTFIGSTSGNDYGYAVAVDASGGVYVAGVTDASFEAPVRAFSGSDDGFVTKLDNSGNFLWNTFLGGAGTDRLTDIAVDVSGNVYVAGYGNQSWGTPVSAYFDSYDGVAAKLDGSGNLVWNTFLGGSGSDQINGIAVDVSGNVYLVGTSTAVWGSPIDPFSGSSAAMAAKLDSSGNLAWNTFFSGESTGNGVAVHSSGNIFITGNSGNDAFAARLNSSGSLTWSYVFGGAGTDTGEAIAVDSNSNLYVAGTSDATWGTPIRAYGSSIDGFVAKMFPNAAPITGTTGSTTAYTENASPVVVDSGLTISDVDSADFASGTLSVSISANGTANDRLTIVPVDSVTVVGAAIFFGGTQVATYTGGIGTTPLVITMNANSSPSIAQAIGRAVRYFNVSDNPSTATRTINFVITDGDGGTSNVSQKSISVSATADAPIAVNDRHGLKFDGINDYVDVGNHATLSVSSQMTIEAWIRPEAYPVSSNIILNKEGEYEIGLNSTGRLRWAFSNTNPGWAWHDTGYTLALNTWAHISVTYNNGIVNTYVNGNLVEAFNGSGVIGDSHAVLNNLRIGGRQNNPSGQYFNGQIDEVRVWNIARTESEVRSHVDEALLGTETGLVGYWQFNEGTGTATADHSTMGNVGTLVDSGGGVGPQWTGYLPNQNTALNIDATNGLLSNDIDGENDTLVVTEVNGSGANIGATITLTSGAFLTVTSTGSFVYDPNGAFNYLNVGQTATESFTYQVSDGTGNFDTATAFITVSGLNDAPTLDTGTLAAELEDTSSPSGNAISSIFSGQFVDADTASSFGGIAVVGNAANSVTQGIWQYSTDDGSNWFDVGSVNDGANALVLNSSAKLRFVPVPDYAGAPTDLLARGLDNTYTGSFSNGAARATLDTTNNGGTTSVSAATTNVSTSITALNDAPFILSGSVNSTIVVVEDSDFTSLGLSSVTWGPGGGVDESSQSLTVNVSVIPSSQFGAIYLADGNTAVGLGSYSISQLQGMKFKPTSHANGGPSFFQFEVQDNGGTANGGQDTVYHSIELSITGENDAPVAMADSAAAVEAGGAANATTGTNPSGNVLTNDTDVDAGDTMTVNGVVAGTAGSASGNVGSSVTGSYGSITIAANGAYTYTVDNSNASVQALRTSGNSINDVFTYTLIDTDGAPSTTQITVTITGANDTPHDMATTGLSVAENSSNATSVGTITRSDVDTGDTPSFSLVDNAGGRFAIDAATGEVTVADSSLLNYEAATSHNITVRVTDLAGASYDEVFTVNLTNVNEGPVAVADSAAAVEAGGVADATTGTNPSGNVLTNDTDVDAGDTKTVDGVVAGTAGSTSGNVGASVTGSYGSITIAANGAYTYTVDNSNASVQALRTSGNSINDVFSYTMIDTDGVPSTTQITVTITGANDTPHDVDTTGLSVAENSSNATSVGTITRSDVDASDTPSFSLVDNAGGRFSINAATGEVTVANSSLLNYEAATSHNITVRVTDLAGATYDEVFTVDLSDVDEFAVTSPVDSDASSNEVSENAATGSLVGLSAWSIDADATNNSVTYSLVNNASGRFSIDANTGVVSVADGAQLNRELAASHQVTVRATSADGSFAEASFTINLTDVDEFDVIPIVDTNSAANSVSENASIGMAVGITAATSDADATNNSIMYSMVNSDGGRFAVDPTTGIVTVAGAVDREADGEWRYVTLRATSADGSTADQSFAIQIVDVDEFNVSPITDSDGGLNAVDENAVGGALVGIRAFASDQDATINAVSYSLLNDAAGRFTIDSMTGIVRIASGAQLDFEAQASHTIVVQAQSADGSSTSQSFTVVVRDINEAPSTIDHSFSTNNVEVLIVGSAAMQSGWMDPENDSLMVTLWQGPQHGSLNLRADGSFAYTPHAGYVGDDTFSIYASDGQLTSNTAMITITVVLPNTTGASSANPSSGSQSGSPINGNNEASPVIDASISGTANEPPLPTPTGQPTVLSNVDEGRQLNRTVNSDSLVPVISLESPRILPRAVGIATARTAEQQLVEMTLPAYASRESNYAKRWAENRVNAHHSDDQQLMFSEEEQPIEQYRDQETVTFVMPATWTVLSTGVVLWTARAGQVIATLASTASVAYQFDPLTVIHQAGALSKKKNERGDTAFSEQLFDKKQ